MKKSVLLALTLYLLVSSFAFGAGGDMGIGTEPFTDGSESYPFLIEDWADFDVFANPANGATYWANSVHTKLMADIDLDPVIPERQTYPGAVIASIGSFSGVFNGNDHTISNMTISANIRDYIGLFGKIEGPNAQVKNLRVEYVNIFINSFSNWIGGLCGYNQDGTIDNCYSTGSISASDIHAASSAYGGLCGYNKGGTVSNSYSTCSISGGDGSYYLGGLCGCNFEGTIRDCHATGAVNGYANESINIGGFCGYNYKGEIINCYATGSVGSVQDDYLGGLCGYNRGDISNCYATGAVSGDDWLGGLCGGVSEGSISNCYATGAVSGGYNCFILGGLCGDLSRTSTISDSYATGSVTGGDGAENLGGLCGRSISTDSFISNCYSTGWINGGDNSMNLAGLCGYYGSGNISNCFWDMETSGTILGLNLVPGYPGTVTNVVFKTTTQMQTVGTFSGSGWDFVSTWWINEGKDYPKLAWQPFGDLNNDSHVNLYDFAIMSATWQASNGDGNYNSVCELSGDTIIDVADLAELTGMWLAGPSW